jgi:hemerythrin-like domain-containing protein
MHEHRIIERALRALEGMCARLEAGQGVSPDAPPQLLSFLRNFADRCHHGKEEAHLFPELERRGIPREGGPIGVMLYEHEVGRGLLAEMDEAARDYARGQSDAGRRFSDSARRYADLLTNHIYKEDNVLFRIAEGVLDDQSKAQLGEAFERVEAELGLGAHERLEGLASELERAWAR